MIVVDILDPNTFERSGRTCTIENAWEKGLWIPSFNLWIARQKDNFYYLLYQHRIGNGNWASGLLDVAVGGHYEAGETLRDGLREAREELGKDYDFEAVSYLGRRVYLNDSHGLKKRYVVDVCIVEDNSPLTTFTLQRSELQGLYCCSVDDLLRVHTEPDYAFVTNGIRLDVEQEGSISATIEINKESFPFNWDNYHYKMALLTKRFLRGEELLIY